MATAEERLMQWLRDAHAAEEQAETMLTGMAARLQSYPKLRARIKKHITETKRQARLVRGCIKRREGRTSIIKDTGGKLLATGQALSGMFVGDEVMKGSLASYAFEAMEIASYTILINAAKHVGDKETARVCEQILKEEKAMASWLEKNLPMLTRQYLRLEETPGAVAKH
ncbi:MAG TPA: ferritin-like domain-containing protein [Aestuariivirgaceae bacterium]|jgi:ferritin-like metal-binding protein YciE|nr:ferritin-like domain-containing protein [Aestuariivirgaceae bacterium]